MNSRIIARWALVVVTVAGLAIDAYVHFDLAHQYSFNDATISQGALFRIEGVSAVVAGLALLLLPRWYTAVLAALVAGGGAGAVLLYRYHDVGAFGPFPDMYEPLWYPEKTWSFWAEAVAFVTALGVLVLTLRRGIVDRAIWDWYDAILQGNFTRRNGSISVLDEAGASPVVQWEFRGAFPSNWRGPELNAAQSNVAVETFELTHQGLTRVGS